MPKETIDQKSASGNPLNYKNMATGLHDCKSFDIQRFQLEFKDLVTLSNSQRFGGTCRNSWEKIHPYVRHAGASTVDAHYQRGEGGGHLSSQRFQQELQGQGTGMQQRSRQSGQGSSSSGSTQHGQQPLQHSYWFGASSATRDLPRASPTRWGSGGNRWSPSNHVCRTCKTALGSLKIRGDWGREVNPVTALVTWFSSPGWSPRRRSTQCHLSMVSSLSKMAIPAPK